MSSDHKRNAGRVIVAGYFGDRAPDAYRSLAGVILFKRNLKGSMADVARQIAGFAPPAGELAPLVAVDQEGGRVARLGRPVIDLPPMAELGALDDVAKTERCANILGTQLRLLGFNVDFAPVLDVDTNPKNRVIGDRSFGSDPHLVARHGLAFSRGLAAAGVLACGKHFPGHGDTIEDSHFELPASTHDRERLDAVELVPFRAAVGNIPSLMTAHIVFRTLDEIRPATLSPLVIAELLRKEIGYCGLVFSDDLEMKAIADHFPIAESAVASIRAGCDVLLICKTESQVAAAIDGLAREAASDPTFAAILGRAADRVCSVRASLTCAPVVDEGSLDRQLRAALDPI